MICIWKCTSSIYLSLESGQGLRLIFCVYQLFCLSIPNYLKLSHKAHTLFTHGSAIWARLSWVVPLQVPPVVISVAALTCELLQAWLCWHMQGQLSFSLYIVAESFPYHMLLHEILVACYLGFLHGGSQLSNIQSWSCQDFLRLSSRTGSMSLLLCSII